MRDVFAVGVLFSSTTFAAAIIGTPGCYTVRGIVNKIEDKKVELITEPGARSEDILTIQFDKKPEQLKKDAVIVLAVYAPTKGYARGVRLESKVASAQSIPVDEFYKTINWKWIAKDCRK